MTPNNIRQSYMPEGAIPIKNPNGTAPCFIVEQERSVIYSLPGVPVEMKWLFENEVENPLTCSHLPSLPTKKEKDRFSLEKQPF